MGRAVIDPLAVLLAVNVAIIFAIPAFGDRP